MLITGANLFFCLWTNDDGLRTKDDEGSSC